MQLSAPTVHEMIGRLERRRLRRPRRRQVARVHRRRPPPRAADRPPPPPDRALPHRRARRPVGRGPRGGRAARARDVAGARGAHAGRDRRRQDLPHGHPLVEGVREQGVLLADVEPGRQGPRAAVRERGRGAAALPQGRRACTRPRGSGQSSGDDEVVVASEDGAHSVSRSVAETVSVRADPAPRRARRSRSSSSSLATATGAS